MAGANGSVAETGVTTVSVSSGVTQSYSNGRDIKTFVTPPPLELSSVAPDVIPGPNSPVTPGPARPTLALTKSGSNVGAAIAPATATATATAVAADKKKLGHRRVKEGEVTYKKIETSTIMGAIQLGIAYAVGSEASKPTCSVVFHDFFTVETIDFPGSGGKYTPAHHYSDFRMKIYAKLGFKYFRDLFKIRSDDFLLSMCNSPLRELSNAGASGSIFYLSVDDKFIVKTVQHKEGDLLMKLMPGYFINFHQNARTLLPQFFGLFCYHCNSKNIRLVVMNNLLPSSIKIHQRYDLKGSTYKRKANSSECAKQSPTYKDLDFLEQHPQGLILEAETYASLLNTIKNDCRVLESFRIMDYSMLIGVHNIDLAAKEKLEKCASSEGVVGAGPSQSGECVGSAHPLASASASAASHCRQRLMVDSGGGGGGGGGGGQVEFEATDEYQEVIARGIPARNSKGEQLLLFIGIIDILQSYRMTKRLEHSLKAMVHDGNTISVHRPDFYSKRFFEFLAKRVFNKGATPLRHSSSRRRQAAGAPATPAPASAPATRVDKISTDKEALAYSERASKASTVHLPASSLASTEFAVGDAVATENRLSGHVTHVTVRHGSGTTSPPPLRPSSAHKLDSVSVSDIRLDTLRSPSALRSSSRPPSRLSARQPAPTPPLSVDDNTPTWTEGTPSFTESSSSGDIGSPAKSLMTSAGVVTPSRHTPSRLSSRVSTAGESNSGGDLHTIRDTPYRETEMTSESQCDKVSLHIVGRDHTSAVV